MEAALCRLNPALVVAGFELAYERRRVGFRTTLPLQPRGGLLPDEIQTYFRITVKTAADFLPTLSRIASGIGKPQNVLSDAQSDLAGGNSGGVRAHSGPTSLAAITTGCLHFENVMSQPDVHQTFLAAIESAYQTLDSNFDELYSARHGAEESRSFAACTPRPRDAYWRGVATKLCDDNSVVRAVYEDLNRANQELRDATA